MEESGRGSTGKHIYNRSGGGAAPARRRRLPAHEAITTGSSLCSGLVNTFFLDSPPPMSSLGRRKPPKALDDYQERPLWKRPAVSPTMVRLTNTQLPRRAVIPSRRGLYNNSPRLLDSSLDSFPIINPPGLDRAARSPSRPHHPTSHVIARDAAQTRLRDSIIGRGTGFPTPGTDDYSLNKDLITITICWTGAGRLSDHGVLEAVLI